MLRLTGALARSAHHHAARATVGAALARNLWAGHAAAGSTQMQHATSAVPLLSQQQAMRSGAKRWMSAGVDEQLNNLSRLFGDARLELEDCHDSVGTTYFEEDLDLCIELVDEVLDNYKTVLESAGEAEAKGIRQSWGLKLEQLKGELQQLLELHDH